MAAKLNLNAPVFTKKAQPSLVGGTPRVNLLPPGQIERRARTRLARAWGVAVAGAVLFVSLVILGAYLLEANADRLLVEEQERTVQLTAELESYAKITTTVAETKTLEGMRSDAVGNDLVWGKILGDVTAALPSGVDLIGYKLAPGAIPDGSSDAKNLVGLSGTLTFFGTSAKDQATVVGRLRDLGSAMLVDAGQASAEEGGDGQSGGGANGYRFEVTFVANQTVYSGKYLVDGAKR